MNLKLNYMFSYVLGDKFTLKSPQLDNERRPSAFAPVSHYTRSSSTFYNPIVYRLYCD